MRSTSTSSTSNPRAPGMPEGREKRRGRTAGAGRRRSRARECRRAPHERGAEPPEKGAEPPKKAPRQYLSVLRVTSLATVFRRPPPFFVRSAEGAERAERGRGRAEVAEKGAGGVSGRSLRAEFPGGVSGWGRMGMSGAGRGGRCCPVSLIAGCSAERAGSAGSPSAPDAGSEAPSGSRGPPSRSRCRICGRSPHRSDARSGCRGRCCA